MSGQPLGEIRAAAFYIKANRSVKIQENYQNI